MEFRTDLALEKAENMGRIMPDGVKCSTFEREKIKVTHIEVVDADGEKAIGKPVGKYVTVEIEPLMRFSQLESQAAQVVADELKKLLPEKGTVLVAGLGNDEITPDALGPKCAHKIFATRHIEGEIAESTGLHDLRKVCAFQTGVLGETGIEAVDIITAIVAKIKPSAVITVDALAARRVSRLGCTVQLCDSGIVPGSGVGNSRKEINEKTLGVPVISIGIPTVVDASTLASDVMNMNGENAGEVGDEYSLMMVTPREIDLVIERAAKLVSLAVNLALQPRLNERDLLILTA